MPSLKNPFKKEEPAWDDGTDDNTANPEVLFKRRSTIILCIYGAISGFFGMEILKYLAQRFACYAAGVPFQPHVATEYVLTDMIMNIVFFLLIYVVVVALGIGIAFLITRTLKRGRIRDMMEAVSTPLMIGMLICVIISVIMFLIPANIFFIGMR